MTELSAEAVVTALSAMEQKTLGGIVRSLSTGNSVVSPTYFSYDCTDYTTSPGTDGNTVAVHCKAFQVYLNQHFCLIFCSLCRCLLIY